MQKTSHQLPAPGVVHQQYLEDVKLRNATTHKNLGWVAPAPPGRPPQNTDVQTPSVRKDIPGGVVGRTT